MKKVEVLIDELRLPGANAEDRLSKLEQFIYTNLVYKFATAKVRRDYELSDALRERLKLWRCNCSDEEFIAMADSGIFIFSPRFEDHEHRRLRHLSRLIYDGIVVTAEVPCSDPVKEG